MERRTLYQVQPCIVCGGKTRRGTTDLTFEFAEFTITVQGIPAAICQECGEEYVPGEFGTWLGGEMARLAEFIRATEGFAFEPVKVKYDEKRLVPTGRHSQWATAT
jgi:YgiT-type zinc finger domain-containing protein